LCGVFEDIKKQNILAVTIVSYLQRDSNKNVYLKRYLFVITPPVLRKKCIAPPLLFVIAPPSNKKKQYNKYKNVFLTPCHKLKENNRYNKYKNISIL
jgi:hypothetical protein